MESGTGRKYPWSYRRKRHALRSRLAGLQSRLPEPVRTVLGRAGRRYSIERATRDLPPIRHVQIQTHSRCNADCVFCPYTQSWHHAHPGQMSEALFNRILRELKPWEHLLNRGTIAPYLMQEPMADPAIIDRIEAIYAAFPNTSVEISTNGEPLTPKRGEALVKALIGRKHEIWISHHGMDAETLKRVMDTRYDRSVANIVHLLRVADGRLNIRIVGAGQSLDGAISYFDESRYRSYWQQILAENSVPERGVEIETIRFHDRAGTLRREGMPRGGIIREIGPANPFRCYRVDEWLHVLHDGRIRLCCMDYHGEVELPSLADTTLVEYFRSETYKSLLQSVTGAKETADDFICKRCQTPGG